MNCEFEAVMEMDLSQHEQGAALQQRASTLHSAREEGKRLHTAKKLTQASQVYSEAMSLDKSHARFNAMMLCNIAAGAAAQHRLIDGIAHCNKALQLHSTNVRALQRRARLLSTLGEHAGAVQDYSTLLRCVGGKEAREQLAEAIREQDGTRGQEQPVKLYKAVSYTHLTLPTKRIV
eukprot:TRINITY_DN3571_c0_g2_i2.p2 TRINITY_DN3571_c0_g2~~TRINITY_DN3571_c0_g2_i2.p2  ORF type:complete len:177 (-),score=70.25 TRINITY_DN3571_c0_g2_i2:88-618(-)